MMLNVGIKLNSDLYPTVVLTITFLLLILPLQQAQLQAEVQELVVPLEW